MRSIAKTIILAATVAALAALLLAGCQRSDQKEPAKTRPGGFAIRLP